MRDDLNLRPLAAGEMQTSLLESSGVREFLDAVVTETARMITPIADCSLTVGRESGFTVGAASSPGALRCDQAEYAASSGPCLDAIRSGSTVAVFDIATDPRWPGWSAAALAEGYGSAFAVPHRAGPDAAVSLNLYAAGSHVFTDEHVRQAESYVAELAGAVGICLRLNDQSEVHEDLKRAMASRSIIDQAVGVIMAQNVCSPAEAMAILRSASNHRNVKLRDVAGSIVVGLVGPVPDDPNFVDKHR